MGFFAVSGNRFSSAVFGVFRVFFVFFYAILEVIFGSARKNFRFFLVFGVSGLDGALQKVVGRETLQNKGGFGAIFRFGTSLTCIGHVVSPRCCTHFLRIVFGSLAIFFFTSSNFWPNWVWKPKPAWGCRTEVVLKITFFPLFPGEDQFVTFLVRGCRVLGSSRTCCHKWPGGCGAEGFSEFFGALLSTPFLRIWKGISWNSPLFFSCFALFCVFFLGLGSTQPCTCVLGQLALNPSFRFLSFYKNTVFPLKKDYFVHFSVYPFLSPWLHSLLLFHSLYLSLYFLVSCFSFLVVWFFCDLPCFFRCSFLPCFFAFVSWKQQHQNIRCERFLFINSFCFGGFPVLLCLSNHFFLSLFSLFKFCVLVNMNVFIFLRRPFLKHRFLFCTLRNIIVFIGAHFVGKFWLMCKKHCKNRYFSTSLIEQETRQKSTISRGSSLGRVGLLVGISESVGLFFCPPRGSSKKPWE